MASSTTTTTTSNTNTNHREFDLIIFGATGFTGFFVVRELLLSLAENSSEYSNLKWAIAGRNECKLQNVLTKVGTELKQDLCSTVKILANVQQCDSLYQMAKRARLVVNTVGPYRFFGRQVVDACVRAGTHHIDISGEPQYIESIQADYHQMAHDAGILVLSTCGWESIPADVGVDYLKRHFNGRLALVEAFLQYIEGPDGFRVNFSTLQSAIYGIVHKDELRAIRQRLFTDVVKVKLPKSRHRLNRAKLPFHRAELPGWQVEFPGSDRSVVQRTQYYNYEHFNEPPVQIQTYFTLATIWQLISTLIVMVNFYTLTLFSFGRSLLERYPSVFTFGLFTKDGPTRAQINTTRFQTTLIGRGWSQSVLQQEQLTSTDVDVEPKSPMDRTVIVRVSGLDPAYVATSSFVIQSALTILKEREHMPKGGVLTPASAFRDTKLLDRLSSRDIKFELLDDGDGSGSGKE